MRYSAESTDIDGHLTLLVASNQDGSNIYHQLWLKLKELPVLLETSVYPLFEFENVKRISVIVGIPHDQNWIERIFQAFPVIYNIDIKFEHVNSSLPPHDRWDSFFSRHHSNDGNCAFIQQHSYLNLLPVELGSWNSNDYQVYAPLQSWMARFRTELLHKNDNVTCARKKRMVLFVQRNSSGRALYDSNTRKPLLLAYSVNNLGFDFKQLDIEGTGIEEQAQAFADASIVISVHGAQLSNLIFMTPCAKFLPAVIEVSLRYGYCGYREPGNYESNEKLVESQSNKCSSTGRRYIKSEFFGLVKTTGYTRYLEVVNNGIVNQLLDGNPIKVDAVLVDSKVILDQLGKLRDIQGYDYRSQPIKGEISGIEKYEIT